MRRAVAVGLGAMAVATWWSAPADAADHAGPSVAVSSDGVTWSSDLARPLFDRAVRWVPGDVRTGAFFVRNQGPYGVSVRIEARDAGTGRLTSSGDVVLYARASGGSWHRLPVGGESERLNRTVVPAGGTSRIEVRAVFLPESGNETQVERSPLSFVVRLADARFDAAGGLLDGGQPGTSGGASAGEPGGATGGHADSSGGGHLPATGAPSVRLPVAAGATLMGTGLALVRRRPAVRRG
jgi:hypothetical protein